MQATINVRMGSALKDRGDSVLRESGVGVSQVVRALWEELASTHRIPECIENRLNSDADAERQRKIAAFTDLLKQADEANLTFGDGSRDDIRDALYEDKWNDYMALR